MRNNLILDLGCHFGHDSEFYLRKGFRVISIDANPKCCEIARKRLQNYISTGQLTLIEKAICEDVGGKTDFLINTNHTDWGTLDPKWNAQYGDDVERITVSCTTIKEIIPEGEQVYYAKIDIEGADIICLKQLRGFELPKYISVELLTFNNILDKNVNCLELISELLNLGYKKFQIVDQSKNHLTKCPHPAREGKYTNYKFDGYCSGLFGKELPIDKWTDIEEILFKYFHYFYNTKNCKGESLNKDGWFDLHATF